jgi:RNA recognition motif-containing protein
MKLFIGNLSRQVKDEDLRTSFTAFGSVTSAEVVKDKFSGESRGFGFVEMGNRAEAEAAVKGMNGKELLGQSLVVNEARPKPDRSGRSGGGYGGYGGGRGR